MPVSPSASVDHGQVLTPNDTQPVLVHPLTLTPSPSFHLDASRLRPYPHQVAGHGLHSADGLLCYTQAKGEDGRGGSGAASSLVLKPLHRQLKGYIELAFYRHIQQQQRHEWHPFLPRCHGVAILPSTPRPPSSSSSPSSLYLVLDDLASAFPHPCVLDVKMGTQTFDEAASPSKVAEEVHKFPHQHLTGCRVAGMRTFTPATATHATRTKAWCRALTPTDMPVAITAWLTCDGELPLPPPVVHSLLAQLHQLRRVFEVQTAFRFYSSSLLLLYDPLRPALEPLVRMIDFTHTFGVERRKWITELMQAPSCMPRAVLDGWRGQVTDEAASAQDQRRVDGGYLTGLDTLIDMLQGIASSSPPLFSDDE